MNLLRNPISPMCSSPYGSTDALLAATLSCSLRFQRTVSKHLQSQ